MYSCLFRLLSFVAFVSQMSISATASSTLTKSEESMKPSSYSYANLSSLHPETTENEDSSFYDNDSSSHSESSSSEFSFEDSLISDLDQNNNKESNEYSMAFTQIWNELISYKTFNGPYQSEALNQKIKTQEQHAQAQFQLWKQLYHIKNKFVEKAVITGRKIIEESALPLEQRTITPVQVGGTAGGSKYIVNGILFKFSEDQRCTQGQWLYGGRRKNTERAAKATRRELSGANYLGSFISSLRSPLMLIIDHLGHCLIASALLPITDKTLVYGSADGGETCYSNPQIAKIMRSIGQELNSQPHIVNNTQMASCGDLEIHQPDSSNPLYYCLDPARMFPPEQPSKSKPERIFSDFLRPEFVRSYPTPLSSDGYSGFQRYDPLAREYNTQLNKASEYLHKKLIPQYIQKLMNAKITKRLTAEMNLGLALKERSHGSASNPFISHLHKHGINIRHLGEVYKQLDAVTTDGTTLSEDNLAHLKKYIGNLMMARVIKNYMRAKLRKKTKQNQTGKKNILKIMNLLVCKKPSSHKFWTKIISKRLKSKFGVTMTYLPDQLHQGFQLINLCKSMGIMLHHTTIQRIEENYQARMNLKFDYADIIEIKLMIKSLNIMDFITGMYHAKMLELGPSCQQVSQDYKQKAYHHLKQAMQQWSNEEHPILPDQFFERMKTLKSSIDAQKKADEVLENSKQNELFCRFSNAIEHPDYVC